MNRREFLQKVFYGSLCLPALAVISKIIKGTDTQAKIKPHPARYYQKLAG